MTNVWCVEDDAGIRDIEIYTLKSTGFEARGFEDGKSFMAALSEEKPDLVILDIMLPGMDGVEILKALRSNPSCADISVIMATAKGTEYDKIQSLDLGADDYLVKPFGMMEMVSRIRAVLRRSGKGAEGGRLLSVKGAGGTLELNTPEHTVLLDGERVELTLKEFEILSLFMQHPGMVFTRDQLFCDVWGADFLGETRTVDVHIRTLRRKLGNASQYIVTVRGVGYKLEA